MKDITNASQEAAYERGRRDELAAIIKRVTDDAGQCDCFAYEDSECACGARDGYKTVPMYRVIEIINGEVPNG